MLRAMEVLQELPDDVVDGDCFPKVRQSINVEQSDQLTGSSKLVYLLQSPHLDAQTVAYSLIKTAALRYTEKNVIEAGLSLTGDFEARLPVDLIHLLTFDDFTQFDEDNSNGSDPVLVRVLFSHWSGSQ
jgi:hypothetical protein